MCKEAHKCGEEARILERCLWITQVHKGEDELMRCDQPLVLSGAFSSRRCTIVKTERCGTTSLSCSGRL